MPTVTQHSSRLTIHTRKYAPALPVNSSGEASVSRGAGLGADSAAPLAGCGGIGFSPVSCPGSDVGGRAQPSGRSAGRGARGEGGGGGGGGAADSAAGARGRGRAGGRLEGGQRAPAEGAGGTRLTR